jgi:hypothetical protein
MHQFLANETAGTARAALARSSNSTALRPMKGRSSLSMNPVGCGGIMKSRQYFAVLFSVSLGGCALEAEGTGIVPETVGQSESELCKNALSRTEEKTVLKLIDDICGDTWCEGDHNFAFERLTCRNGATDSPNGGTCTLQLRLIPHDDSSRSYPRTCTTGGFFGFDSLVETAQSDHPSLVWDYYLALTDCVNELEAALTHR